MANNNENKILNVPPLRFPEFTGEWQCKAIEKVAPLQRGFDLPTQNLVEGIYPVIYSNGILQHHDKYKCEAPGLITGRSGTIGKFTYIDSGFYWPHNTSLWVTDFCGNCPKFIYYLYQTVHIEQFSTGSGVPTLNRNDVHRYKTSVPTAIVEQEKIAKFLSILDERIVTQNKIIEDLKKLKSAISLKMLHSDSWEQFKIQDIASIGRGRVISSVEISQQENPLYPVYSSQTSNDGIMGYLDDFMFEGEYISWTTDGANAGTVFYRNGKFNCTNVCGLLKLKKGFDAHFVSLVLAEATRMYVSTNLANPKLMNNTMGNIQIRLPKLEEQKRISVVFRKLHGLLETHNSLIIKYSKQKQYLLSQMFI